MTHTGVPKTHPYTRVGIVFGHPRDDAPKVAYSRPPHDVFFKRLDGDFQTCKHYLRSDADNSKIKEI